MLSFKRLMISLFAANLALGTAAYADTAVKPAQKPADQKMQDQQKKMDQDEEMILEEESDEEALPGDAQKDVTPAQAQKKPAPKAAY